MYVLLCCNYDILPCECFVYYFLLGRSLSLHLSVIPRGYVIS
uniref:Uncharacterized protein n=1 Tax=Arundo donax TaxID=35708 RepID=A0A0A9CIS4_ARUDO